jgi:hypothetical protein
MKIPCKNCILFCVCRQKEFFNIVSECSFVRNFILDESENIKVGQTTFYGTNRKKVKEVYKALKKPMSVHEKHHPFFYTK